MRVKMSLKKGSEKGVFEEVRELMSVKCRTFGCRPPTGSKPGTAGTWWCPRCSRPGASMPRSLRTTAAVSDSQKA